jgi:hypothetical protein
MFAFQESRSVLESTPGAVRALLLHLPERLLNVNEGENTWSPFQVVCHLVHGEIDDWVPRIRLILTKGTATPFRTFDRKAGFGKYGGWEVQALLDEFAGLRADNLRTVDDFRIGLEQMQLEGMHPSLGRVTLEQLLACWVTHDLSHICQISRVLARHHGQYAGPWREFISILGGSR